MTLEIIITSLKLIISMNFEQFLLKQIPTDDLSFEFKCDTRKTYTNFDLRGNIILQGARLG